MWLCKTKIVLEIVLTFPHVDKYAIIKIARVKARSCITCRWTLILRLSKDNVGSSSLKRRPLSSSIWYL